MQRVQEISSDMNYEVVCSKSWVVVFVIAAIFVTTCRDIDSTLSMFHKPLIKGLCYCGLLFIIIISLLLFNYLNRAVHIKFVKKVL